MTSTRPTPTNTRWRDGWGRRWAWALAAAVSVHAALLLFVPDEAAHRLRRALIPDPTAFVQPGRATTEMEAVAVRDLRAEPAETTPAPAPAPEVEVPTVSRETSPEITLAEATAVASDREGTEEGAPGGEGVEAGGGGGGGTSPPRPLGIVVPTIPDGVDRDEARGQRVRLLVEVLPDGRVGEVRIEVPSRIAALDRAAIAAARRMRYAPARRDGVGISGWTRAELRF